VLSDAVAGWRFTPALETAIDADGKPVGPSNVPSKVMVASMFRAPTLLTPTLGEKTRRCWRAIRGRRLPVVHAGTTLSSARPCGRRRVD
jgi:hypothetical protein